MNLVSSWNEWDPLKEVIVGTARGAAEVAFEPSLAPYYPQGRPLGDFGGRPVIPELINQAERQLDAFARLLESFGITVRRPDAVNHFGAVKTPDWTAPCGHATACPRDVLLVIGDEIIEAPMAQRYRYFEFRAYRRLMKEYFAAGARWTTAPKPQMSAELYRDRVPTEFEPVFDAACFARCGRDIFWQPDLVSNETGVAWLRRHLGPGFRIHRVRFRGPLPTHIDTTLVPLRPGLVLTNPQRPCVDDSLDVFARNGWRMVDGPPSVRSGRNPARDVSNWISMNVLVLDERTVVVEQAEKPMMELLRSLEFECVPCAFDSVYPFGGGFHCCTADIRREGVLQSYFPALD